MLLCPICKKRLTRNERTYSCDDRHCFDMAKEGYVNLLVSNKSAYSHGDDKEMVASRTVFLDGGYYAPLREKVCEIMEGFGIDGARLLDAGCGEGYYTAAYTGVCESVVGIDISKAAVRHAARRCKNALFAVASVYHLPLEDECFDVIVNCFSPNAPDEFMRVLKDGGYLIYVVPAPRHLWELKSILYDNPYENEEKSEEYDGFTLERIVPVTTKFSLDTREQIKNLYHMTPYTWNTPREGASRLEGVERLDVTADFRLHIFRKNRP